MTTYYPIAFVDPRVGGRIHHNVECEGITDFFSEAYRHLRGIYLALIGVRSNLKPSAREMVKQYGKQLH